MCVRSYVFFEVWNFVGSKKATVERKEMPIRSGI